MQELARNEGDDAPVQPSGKVFWQNFALRLDGPCPSSVHRLAHRPLVMLGSYVLLQSHPVLDALNSE
jgi:hypothetical protein